MGQKKHRSKYRHKIASIGLDTAYGALSVGAGAAPSLLQGTNYATAGCVAFSACALVALAARHLTQVGAEPHPVDVASLDCALAVLHSLTLTSKKVEVEPKLRICVYVRYPNDADHLWRATSLVGDSEVDTEPREISVKSGVVGKVALTGKTLVARMEKDGNLVEYLTEWGFKPDEAVLIREDRRAWCGIPLGATGQSCVGVLFCDSSDPKFFGEENSARQKILRQGAVPIAQILKKSYNDLFV